jgi:N-dimethylarginine dimethylaminohydrolase
VVVPAWAFCAEVESRANFPNHCRDSAGIEVSEKEAIGLGANGLILNSETVIVERRQTRLINTAE